MKVLITPRQVKRWLEIRRKTDVIQDIDLRQLRGKLAKQLDADVQLTTAVLLLKLMRLGQLKSAA